MHTTRWARATLVVGALASLGFNYGATALDRLPAGAYLVATLWPVLLFLAIELIARTDWGRGRWSLAGRALVGVLVGGTAAWVSYWHGVAVLRALAYDTVSAHVGPLAVDAALALATAALARVARARRAVEQDARAQVPEVERDWDEWARALDEAAPRSPEPVALTAPSARASADPEPDGERARVEAMLARYPGLTAREIAEHAGVAWDNAARNRIDRARRAMRERQAGAR